jgi:hypothetical protein
VVGKRRSKPAPIHAGLRIKRRRAEDRLRLRALVVLLTAEGRQNKDIAVAARLDRCQLALRHWNTRTRAKHLGAGATTLRRERQCNGLKPHLSRSFKLSRNSRFEEKLLDGVGLYMNPPESALVLSCDQKSPIRSPQVATASGLNDVKASFCITPHTVTKASAQ